MEIHDSSSLPPARILIVDDHPNTASMLARALGRFETPVEVLTACSGEEAMETIGDGLVDVLITDFMMTGMSGLDLIEKLKGGREPAHTILITAFDTPGLAITARRLKVQDYLVKPVQPEKIRDIVSRVLSEIRPSHSGNGNQAAQKTSTILIADDNPDNIRLLAVRLKSEGYEYTTAMDGEETLQQLHETPPDLLLLDINMPKKDGFQVLKEMRADSEVAHIPVIVITAARIMVNDIREGLTLGADDYVTKPVDWRELSARIRAKLRVKQAEDALRSRNRELGMLPEIGETLAERLDINSLAEKILTQTVGALNATNGFLIIFRPDGSSTFNIFKELEACPWTSDELHSSLTNDGLASFIISNQQPIIIENTQKQPQWKNFPNEPTQSAIGVPLLGRQKVLGVLILTHPQVGFFHKDHLKIIQAVASQAAMAIENAQLFTVERKRVNELVALNQVTHEISLFTHTEELFKNIPQLINQSLGYPTVAFWEVISQSVSLKGISGADKALRQSLLAVAPQQAVVTGLPTQFSGPMEERTGERSLTGKPPTQSVIAVPLSWAGRVGGVLSIHSQQTSAFQESDRVLLEMLASQVVTVLERIRLYESVEQERKRLAAVLYGAADAILVLDADGRLQLANHAGKRLFTDIDMQLGFPLPVEKGYDALIELLRYERSTNIVEQGEVPWPDGRTFSVQIAPIEVGGQVAILHDVSHFKALDQLKNEFIATASHDLKNPIFAVLGYADLLKKAGPLNEMQGEFMQRIRNAAVQMQDLVLNLLEIARMEMGTELNKENVNIHELLNEVAEEFKSQVEAKRHQMIVSLAEGPAFVYGDRVRLQQVIRNLLGNAIKYTPSNGEVWLTTEIDGGKLDIQFKDNGIGIPVEDIPNLFTKFYRVQNEATKDIEGNGLGLAIVKSIVEQHKGSVSVESQVGLGSTFSVSLPIAR